MSINDGGPHILSLPIPVVATDRLGVNVPASDRDMVVKIDFYAVEIAAAVVVRRDQTMLRLANGGVVVVHITPVRGRSARLPASP